MKSYRVIGIMSGTSLDGLDLAYCEFFKEQNHWSYKIQKAETVSYSHEWEKRLKSLAQASALEFVKTNNDYGHFIGRKAKSFINKNKLEADFISSHGHTLFHQPELGFTSQIGNGASIAAETGLDVICDFRSLDISLQGQGAPLVPIGDRILFSEFDYRLNLGGFANISFEKNEKTLAFDIAPANIALNYYAEKVGLPYDKNGKLAKEGELIPKLLDKLNALAYYQQKGSKSLGREWLESEFIPSINPSYPIPDILNTLVYHLSHQIAIAINESTKEKAQILITGGGAYNSFLIEKLRKETDAEIIIPSDNLIQFKEALIFAFLGVLRFNNQINTLKSVTGAKRDSIGGIIYKGNRFKT
jgi:anhydro-N-acetylmuramic acid kinase